MLRDSIRLEVEDVGAVKYQFWQRRLRIWGLLCDSSTLEAEDLALLCDSFGLEVEGIGVVTLQF